MKSISYQYGDFKLAREVDMQMWMDLLFIRKNEFLIEVLKLTYWKTNCVLERTYHVFTDDELNLIYSFENEEALPVAR